MTCMICDLKVHICMLAWWILVKLIVSSFLFCFWLKNSFIGVEREGSSENGHVLIIPFQLIFCFTFLRANAKICSLWVICVITLLLIDTINISKTWFRKGKSESSIMRLYREKDCQGKSQRLRTKTYVLQKHKEKNLLCERNEWN
jgi:hypothetical protein